MIRYYLDQTLSLMAAAQCQHPALARLRGRGPWSASESPGGVMLQRGNAAAWGEIKNGLDGLRYQLADPLPPIMSSITVDERGAVAFIDLPGCRLPIKLAAYAPVSIGLDGTPQGPCDEYGQAGVRLWDRLNSGELLVADPELIAFCRLALMSKTNLTAELVHAYNLITTETIPQIFDTANGIPKAEAGGG
mgnify:CR=1 FL=1